jgi:hypothetical protein
MAENKISMLSFDEGKVEVLVTEATDDGAAVVFIDTEAGAGRLRVRLNDATIWDADPESHEHTECTCAHRKD